MRAISTGSKSARMTPLLGLAFLISAMSLIGPPAARGAKKSRTLGASGSRARTSLSGIVSLARWISARFVATIWSRIVGTTVQSSLFEVQGWHAVGSTLNIELGTLNSNVVHSFWRALEPLDQVGERHAVQELALFGGDFL